ncbi:5'/3'-nucleotidase SurE [bacterium]|nr:5'/3'-nucleotidase SurE [bacterium]
MRGNHRRPVGLFPAALRHRTIVLTNDDGIFAEGLQAMRASLVERGLNPVVVAPDRGASGASRSLSLNRPLTLREIAPDQYTVDGTPTDCVMLALFEVLRRRRPPAILLSGINHGQNLGDDVTYSGTCAAAAEGCMERIPSVALSALPCQDGSYHFRDHADYFADRILPRILRLKVPRYSFLNLNFPPVPAGDFRGIRIVPMGRSTYQNPILRQRHPDPYHRKDRRWVYWIAGAPKAVKHAGTDIEAIRKGYVSLSPVRLELNHPELLAHCRRAFTGIQ